MCTVVIVKLVFQDNLSYIVADTPVDLFISSFQNMCTIYLAIFYDLQLFLLTLLHHRIISMAMIRTGF